MSKQAKGDAPQTIYYTGTEPRSFTGFGVFKPGDKTELPAAQAAALLRTGFFSKTPVATDANEEDRDGK